MTKYAAVILAAGRSRAFGQTLPRQYHALAGQMLLRHSLNAFAFHPKIACVRVVIHPDDQQLYSLASHGLSLMPPVFGGETRSQSLKIGLESLRDEAPDVVIIHDGIRPLVDQALINRLLSQVDVAQGIGALAGIPVADALKRVDEAGRVIEDVSAANLWQVQTPQAFPFAPVYEAYAALSAKELLKLRDDDGVIGRTKLSLRLVRGKDNNAKVASATDMARASGVIAKRFETRIGSAMLSLPEEETSVVLGGVLVSGGDEGRTSPDILLAALTESLFGSLGVGDTIRHFPPKKKEWKGLSPEVFLQHAVGLLEQAGGTLTNVDISVMAEDAEHLSARRGEIHENLATLLKSGMDKINVKFLPPLKEGRCTVSVSLLVQKALRE